jgi:23S rRNA pseudouridine1911/1915/1917 synthase
MMPIRMNPEPTIIWEDADIVAIAKPAGIASHPDGRSSVFTVSDWFRAQFPASAEIGQAEEPEEGDVERPGIVHRLDKDTSGVMLLAKTAHGYGSLKKQFAKRQVFKEYHTFVYGIIKEERGRIDRPIGRSSDDFRKRAVRDIRGEEKEAVTIFKVLARTPEATWLEARPQTGRTHQIRVHMAAIHHPIIADSLYAAGKPQLLGFKRLALHAFAITFRDISGSEHRVECPYPEDFAHAAERMKEAVG